MFSFSANKPEPVEKPALEWGEKELLEEVARQLLERRSSATLLPCQLCMGT
jgi:hypothetical protein